jgi:hypothetical protein
VAQLADFQYIVEYGDNKIEVENIVLSLFVGDNMMQICLNKDWSINEATFIY